MISYRVARGLALWLVAITACSCGDNTHDPRTGCVDNADCPNNEFCDWEGRDACGNDHAQGTCVGYKPELCPELGFWVCGCDGITYTNQCQTNSRALPINYGGPCRPAGAFVTCTTSADCTEDAEFPQYCVDDPRDACAPGNDTACPGVCVHGNYVCSDTIACLSASSISIIDSPGTEACVAVQGCTDPSCAPGRCVYTTRATCRSAADCGSGELCLPELGCDPRADDCRRVCVRP